MSRQASSTSGASYIQLAHWADLASSEKSFFLKNSSGFLQSKSPGLASVWKLLPATIAMGKRAVDPGIIGSLSGPQGIAWRVSAPAATPHCAAVGGGPPAPP